MDMKGLILLVLILSALDQKKYCQDKNTKKENKSNSSNDIEREDLNYHIENSKDKIKIKEDIANTIGKEGMDMKNNSDKKNRKSIEEEMNDIKIEMK